MISRRTLLATGTIALLPLPARAADFVIDWQGMPPDPAIQTRLERQIAIVRAAPVRPDIARFWAGETIHVIKDEGYGSHARGGLYLTRDPFPDANPVLLHELIHRWHFTHMAPAARDRIRTLYDAARAVPHWPAASYMYQDAAEYLAMCASVVIHGRAARAPFTRDQVREQLPATYAFIVAEFGLPAS